MTTSLTSILEEIAKIDSKIVRYELAQRIAGDVNDTFYDARIGVLKSVKETHMEKYTTWMKVLEHHDNKTTERQLHEEYQD